MLSTALYSLGVKMANWRIVRITNPVGEITPLACGAGENLFKVQLEDTDTGNPLTKYVCLANDVTDPCAIPVALTALGVAPGDWDAECGA